ncbi:tyrosine-type recombinase/integrase [Vagococcus lutrae]|uniref:tyrosine-type recombinase/integrase n=1 Tax=Vagococcus lutrae TaxID=81947 RepID=UPI00200BCAB3|nr:tyrosine-type recombinase/integrase [Vagococcus lutrae]UQF11467.1 site-specific integrase [Vagococcus lutrae]
MVKRRKDNKGVVLREGEHQRANGTYEYKWRDKIGRRKSIYAKTLPELRERQKEILRNSLDGIDSDNSTLTINDMFNLWKKVKRGLKDNTFKNYIYMYQQFVEPTFGQLKLVEVKRSDVRAFYNRLKEDQGLKVSTIDCVHTILHQVLDLALDDDYLRYNPSDNALKELKSAYRHETPKKKAMTIEEQALFEKFLSSSNEYRRWYPIFTVMLWTGMRVGEITGLQWNNLDFDEGLISVEHTLVYYSKGKGLSSKYAINTPKTKAGTRKIPMIEKVKEAFLIEKEMQEVFEIECKDTIDGYSNFVFLNRFGKVHNNNTLNKSLRRIVRDCNLKILDQNKSKKEKVILVPHLSNHIFRHTFTTRMNEQNMNTKAMQSILGHADITITMDIYTDATEDFKIEQMQAFEKAMMGSY